MHCYQLKDYALQVSLDIRRQLIFLFVWYEMKILSFC
jgi:hypothetical protein